MSESPLMIKSKAFALEVIHACKTLREAKCEGALISDDKEIVAGGFITFSQKVSLITDVYTDESHRGQGYGKAIVEKLLNTSTNKDVYLVSKEHNLDFYKKCVQL